MSSDKKLSKRNAKHDGFNVSFWGTSPQIPKEHSEDQRKSEMDRSGILS